MNKYKAKEQKKQDLLTTATKKKHRNQILTYLIKHLVSANTIKQKKKGWLTKETKKKHRNQMLTYLIKHLVSEKTLELIKDCNTFMMLVANQTMEKKKQHKGNSCKNRFCPICSWKKARKDA